MKKATLITELTTLLNNKHTVKKSLEKFGDASEYIYENKVLDLCCYAVKMGTKTIFSLMKPYREVSIKNLHEKEKVLETDFNWINMEFTWINRYSDRDLPDKHGRWARLCFFNSILIAWISRINNENKIMYYVRDFFPSSGNDMPEYSDIENNFEIAKKSVEKRFDRFAHICNKNKYH